MTDAVDPRHQAQRGCPRPAARRRRRPDAWTQPVVAGLGARPSARRRRTDGLPALSDAPRRVADRRRAADGLPREGDPRGQAAHHLERPGRGVRSPGSAAWRMPVCGAGPSPRPSALGARRSHPPSAATNLAAKLLQLTLPGVPDVYQGCELTSYSLVDPDNRRPVDFQSRARRLSRARGRSPARRLDDDKLWVTSHGPAPAPRTPESFGRRRVLPAA